MEMFKNKNLYLLKSFIVGSNFHLKKTLFKSIKDLFNHIEINVIYCGDRNDW